MKKVIAFYISIFLFVNYFSCFAQDTQTQKKDLQEQKKELILNSINLIGNEVNKSIYNRNLKKSNAQIAEWQQEGNDCAVQSHPVDPKTGNLVYDNESVQLEVECLRERESMQLGVTTNTNDVKESQANSQEYNAQSPKIAYVNSMEVITAMPEYKQMQDSLSKLQTEFQVELKGMSDEYTKKLSDYVAQQNSLTTSINAHRQQELQDLQQRAENFQQYATQQQDKIQKRLSIPIQDKLQKAINEVGKENNFPYIIDYQVLLYISPTAMDATILLKKKLGLK